MVYSAVWEVQIAVFACVRSKNTGFALGRGREHSSHVPVVITNTPRMTSRVSVRWQDELYGWEIKAFEIALSQNHPVIRCLRPSCELTYDPWSKMWFLPSNTIGSAKELVAEVIKIWHLLEDRVMKECHSGEYRFPPKNQCLI